MPRQSIRPRAAPPASRYSRTSGRYSDSSGTRAGVTATVGQETPEKSGFPSQGVRGTGYFPGSGLWLLTRSDALAARSTPGGRSDPTRSARGPDAGGVIGVTCANAAEAPTASNAITANFLARTVTPS